MLAPNGSQVFKSISLWGKFLIQTGTLHMAAMCALGVWRTGTLHTAAMCAQGCVEDGVVSVYSHFPVSASTVFCLILRVRDSH